MRTDMKLADWRNAAGMSQEQLAAELGVDKATIFRWESGTRDPGRDYKRRIFTMSGGAVQPNDFYDLPAWRKILTQAVSRLRGEAA